MAKNKIKQEVQEVQGVQEVINKIESPIAVHFLQNLFMEGKTFKGGESYHLSQIEIDKILRAFPNILSLKK